jgi:hypothetical protein
MDISTTKRCHECSGAKTYLFGVKAYYEGAKNVVRLNCFLGVSMFELQPW